MTKNKNKIITIVLLISSFIYTILVKFIDVKSIGPKGSKVGFSTMNDWFHKLTGVNMKLYTITEYVGYIILLIVLAYGLIGLIQLIKRKSIFKVDREIFLLGIFYVLIIVTYIGFEKIIINYRPVLIEGVLEASYPSSHTLLALCISISSILVNRRLWSDKTKLINVIIGILGIIVLLGRTLCGVHWLSDIIGGILISSALIMIFYTFLNIKNREDIWKKSSTQSNMNN